MTKNYNLIKWDEIFYYDESSPTCIRWKIDGTKAGYFQYRNKTIPKHIAVSYKKEAYVVARIIWILNHGPIPEGCVVNHIDCNPHNNMLNNLEICSQKENLQRSKVTKGALYVSNETGYNGVHFTVMKSRGNVFEYFTAQWVNRNGKPCKKNFNILKYGVVKAHHLALKCRALNHHPNS